MSLEQQFFQKAEVDFSTLLSFGFTQTEQGYYYSCPILNGQFLAEIWISLKGEVRGRVFDVEMEAEYDNIHIAGQLGEFVHQVREAYFAVLQAILAHCFIQEYFISPQAKRLAKTFAANYGDKPVFPWEKYPNFGVFKHAANEKWYALVMNIDKSKLAKKTQGMVDVVNLKVESEHINNLLQEKGIYPAYHMNKKNWISVILDDTLPDERILQLVQQSYDLTKSGSKNLKSRKQNGRISQWLIPANPKYFDVEQAFREQSEILWKQSSNVAVGDVIYMYVAAPRSAILYKCDVLAINLPYTKKNKYVKVERVMKIRLLYQYAPDTLHLTKLREFGIKGVRGPRSVPTDLLAYLETLA
ncbi:putative DNA-binding protein (MmcQ/YjbR family) [Cricetibacter osteomyelitidis]|uniref:Putative DNA-binding protein (MmcQ/YjbR family) n=1 Tax=Cricetibacter osteomyelitidis TaxID=1521931 RepID=A0A4R2T2I9_9PAST|nr:MmcQ/YjbR family DNA-binding protein [Cricetibacter osteomyelitidis]TCP96185.1 putative DNA-binding protein (MmcQ/YjbR family) [Cricetibacter osteomyelitidis]